MSVSRPHLQAPSRRTLVHALGAAVTVGAVASCTKPAAPAGTTSAAPSTTASARPLVIGSIGSSTGLAGTFERQISLAIGEARIDVNTAGGVLGHEITMLPRTVVSDDRTDLAGPIAALARQHATVAIVSCSEDVLARAMPKFLAAGIVVISVNSISSALRAGGDTTRGMLLRLSPTDAALATEFTKLATSAQEQGLTPRTAHLITRDSSAGKSLEAQLRHRLEKNAYGHVQVQRFPAGRPRIDAAAAVHAKPSLIVVDADQAETAAILTAIRRANADKDGRLALPIPIRTTYYGSGAFGRTVPGDMLQTVTGLRAGAAPSAAHIDEMLNVDQSLAMTGYDFSGEAYDAVVLAALAAQAAGSVTGTSIAEYIPAVLTGGQKVTSFREGRVGLQDGADVAYAGRSGALVLDKGDPVTAEWTVVAHSPQGTIASAQTSQIEVTG